ncbi:hypothetical protein AAG906_034681 [Vitis piasezkii]
MASTQGSSPRTNGKVITILSIDGGGVRGIIPAVILYSLEAELQRIDGPNARIADYFDVIAGTSTGSIVTALLTTPYTPPNPPANASKTNPPPNASKTNRPREAKEIPEFYKKHGPAIFQKRKAPHNSNSGSSLMAVIGFFKDQLKDKLESFLNIRYDNSTLQLKVDEEVGTIRLADTLTDVLIPAYDIEHRKLVTFSSHQERNKVPKSSLPLRQAVLGSAAAPTYFPRHHFQADGKIYNLTLLAIREAINIFGSRDDNRYLVISLGTGAEGDHHDFVNLGSPFDWILDLKRGIPPLVSLLFETSADMVDTYTSIFLGGGQNSRHQFLRIQDYTLNPKQLKMDKATEDNFNNLINIAKQLLDKPVSFPSSWIGLEPTTTNRDALGRFANDLSKIRGDAAKKLSWSGALLILRVWQGVLVFWDSRVLELTGMEIGDFSVSYQFKNVEDGFCWIFTVGRLREDFWEELGTIRGLWQDPWCIGGDFNVIRFLRKMNSLSRLSSAMRRFSEVIEDMELRDLPLQGGVFHVEGWFE